MNTTELINSIKIKGQFPTDNYFSNADYLVFLNEALKLDIAPLLIAANEEYFLEHKEYSITSGITKYRIPPRAIAAKLRDVKIKDASGNYANILRIFEEDREISRSGYYLKRNSIELSSDLLITGTTLVLSYFSAPSEIVLTSAAAQISSIDTGLSQVVVSSLPSTIITGSVIDWVQNDNPYDLLDFDISVAGVSGTTLTFASLPSGLLVGDWVCINRQSPIPLVPDDLHEVLVQSALVKALASKKDKAAEYEGSVLKEMKMTIINLVEPRVESNDMKFRGQGLLSRTRLY